MTLWIDSPQWPAHGRLWAHLISDSSLDELHAFAAAIGIPRRGFEGDHYDVPAELHAAAVASGAVETDGRDLLQRLRNSGLRMPKRKGDKGVERRADVRFPDGTCAEVDLLTSPREMTTERIFAAMVFVRDRSGAHLVTWSARRREWGAPGGWREPGETPRENAVREAAEETGLILDAAALEPVGYERFRRCPHEDAASNPGLWRPGQDILQVYAARTDDLAPPLRPEDPGQAGPEWVDDAELIRRCAGSFWWPLAAAVLALPSGP